MYFLRYFERSTLKRKLTYSCFFFPLFHEHLFSPGVPRATRLFETSLKLQNIKMELFAEKVNGFQSFVIFVESAILDVLNMF